MLQVIMVFICHFTIYKTFKLFKLGRNANSLTEKWLISSVIPTLGNRTKYTVLTIWHLPNHQLPNGGMTNEVSHFSVRELAFRCKQNVWISMTTVLEVSAQGFWSDFSVCIIQYWDSETTNNSRWLQCVGETKISSCFQRILHFIWRANFWLLFKFDTFASPGGKKSTTNYAISQQTIYFYDKVREIYNSMIL